MAKFKLMKPRIRNMPGRVPVMKLDDDLAIDPARAERKLMYSSDQWKRIRREQMEKRCWTGCGRYAVALDHFFGHEDEQARTLSGALGIPCRARWQERFWIGPFISLCLECHNSKTRFEARGALREWIETRKRPTR